jgi:UDP-GlcNAc:undecaprenyl-phosphate GlcNAc-1-phosphate transferase
MLGGLAMAAVGLTDDIRGLSARTRIGLVAAVVSIVLFTTGAGSKLLDSVFLPPYNLPAYTSLSLSFVISVLIVLGACNSSNLIDGMDGLCSGVMGLISLAFFLLACFLAMYGYSEQLDPTRITLSIAMLGAAIGFLPMNFNPARIFMGDAGSMLLGYNCGILILLFAERGILRWFIAALMIFALPVFDTALAIVRRWRSGKPIFEGDRSHFYDQLVQRGLSVRKTVLLCYALTLFYGGVGLTSMFIQTRYGVALYVAVCLATAVAAWWSGLLQSAPSGKDAPAASASPRSIKNTAGLRA